MKEFVNNLDPVNINVTLESSGVDLTKPLSIKDAFNFAKEALEHARNLDCYSPSVVCKCESAVNVNGFIIGARHTRMEDKFLLYGKIRCYEDACLLINSRNFNVLKVKMFSKGKKTTSLEYAPDYFPLFDGFEISSSNEKTLIELFNRILSCDIYAKDSKAYEEFLLRYKNSGKQEIVGRAKKNSLKKVRG